ncbi:hypothetical protein EYM_01290 [Ignicoccus islandicus DSM 13165]|uniref:Uncharacterized protein n=1 Tax=Ignicoccus islandicus DSM 13165 TaxID=940295 RepID=A0A0U3F3S6_9CREN|nr:hypothetical protein [Ignicoccus islandicus]ALU12197.1 hypothetical protein EYM_01290 [Ignicoccus islandicus DSM 13165]
MKNALAMTVVALLISIVPVLSLLNFNFSTDAANVACRAGCACGFKFAHLYLILVPFKFLCPYLPPWFFTVFLAWIHGLAVAVTALILYKAGEEVKSGYGIPIALTFLLYPGTWGALSFDFHPDNIGLVFMALAYYLVLIKERPLSGYAVSSLAILSKESYAFPILGLALYRVVSSKGRDKVSLLALIAFVAIGYLAVFELLPRLGGAKGGLLTFRWGPLTFDNFVEKLITLPLHEKKFLMLILIPIVNPLAAIASISFKSLLFLPDYFNLFMTLYRYDVKFDFGFHYHAIIALEFAVMILLAVREGLFDKLSVLKKNLGVMLLLNIFLNPITPLPYYSYVYDSLTHQLRFQSLIYPFVKYVTYRPLYTGWWECFPNQIHMLELFASEANPNVPVVVSFNVAPLLSPAYKVGWLGSPATDWRTYFRLLPAGPIYWNAVLYPDSLRTLTGGLLHLIIYYGDYWGPTTRFYLIQANGLKQSFDIPYFLLKKIAIDFNYVKGAGFYALVNATKLRELAKNLSINELPWGVKGPNGIRAPAFGDGYPIGTYRGYLYVDHNGTYEFYLNGVEYVEVDGVTLKPTAFELVLIKDGMFAVYAGKVYLTRGWHEIEWKTYSPLFGVYWKGPYSCAPRPLSVLRLAQELTPELLSFTT